MRNDGLDKTLHMILKRVSSTPAAPKKWNVASQPKPLELHETAISATLHHHMIVCPEASFQSSNLLPHKASPTTRRLLLLVLRQLLAIAMAVAMPVPPAAQPALATLTLAALAVLALALAPPVPGQEQGSGRLSFFLFESDFATFLRCPRGSTYQRMLACFEDAAAIFKGLNGLFPGSLGFMREI